ncbi:ABC transporter ATP-binding protein [Streptomyces noursei]|uniref:ABC transporter ATP-binding protein n=1 Tax=Streptomyces noursei TaxID=1971 RepID=UPI0033F6E087
MVLDEPTATIDAAAEAEVFEKLRTLSGRATTLLIAHRFSTVRTADHIVVLERGQVLEEGTHTELAQRGGIDAELFRIRATGHRDHPVSAATCPGPPRPFHHPPSEGELTREAPQYEQTTTSTTATRTPAARAAWAVGGLALIVLGAVLIWVTQTTVAPMADDISTMAVCVPCAATFVFFGGGAWCLVRAGKQRI